MCQHNFKLQNNIKQNQHRENSINGCNIVAANSPQSILYHSCSGEMLGNEACNMDRLLFSDNIIVPGFLEHELNINNPTTSHLSIKTSLLRKTSTSEGDYQVWSRCCIELWKHLTLSSTTAIVYSDVKRQIYICTYSEITDLSVMVTTMSI